MKAVNPPRHQIPFILSSSQKQRAYILKQLRFITLRDKTAFDSHIRNNRYLNIMDNAGAAFAMGYRASRSAIHRYMQKLKQEDHEKNII